MLVACFQNGWRGFQMNVVLSADALDNSLVSALLVVEAIHFAQEEWLKCDCIQSSLVK
jgi:hypothetical protein